MCGRPDAERFLSELPTSQLMMWRVYDELDPFGEERMDYRFASICQALWNIARDQEKHPKGWPLDDFLVAFGDTPTKDPVVVQPLAYQEKLIDTWVIGHNLSLEAGGK